MSSKLTNNSVYGKTVKKNLSFLDERNNIFKLINNSVYSKRINAGLINNTKKCKL